MPGLSPSKPPGQQPASQMMFRAPRHSRRLTRITPVGLTVDILHNPTDSPLPAMGLPVSVPGPPPPPGCAPDTWPVLLLGALNQHTGCVALVVTPWTSSSGSSGPPGNPPRGPTQPQLEDPSYDARGTSGCRRLLTDPHFPWCTSAPSATVLWEGWVPG